MTVSRMEGQFWTLTAPDGTYRFDCVSAGDHMLATSKAGYRNQSQPVAVMVGRTTPAEGTYTLYPVVEGTYLLTASDSYGVTVDQTTTADFVLITPGPEICDDGMDSDLDGLVDCLDSGCNQVCVNCSDRIPDDAAARFRRGESRQRLT